MVRLLTIRSYPTSEHLFMCKQDLGIGCGLKSKAKKVGKATMKGLRVAKKATDVIENLQSKVFKELGTNKKIRDVIEAVPFGDTINAVTKVAADVINVGEKVRDKAKKHQKPFDEETKNDVKKIITDAKNDPAIKKLMEESKNMIKSLFGKVNDSDLPQKEKEEIKDKAETINLDLIEKAATPSVAGKLAKSLPYAMFVDRNAKKPSIPKKYIEKFGLPKKSLNNEGGRLFLSGSAGRLGLGLTLKTPTPEAGKIEPKKQDKKKVSKKEIYDILFN